jgi:hypothetical protein
MVVARREGEMGSSIDHYKGLKPFVWAALAWGAVGSALVALLSPELQRAGALVWWLAFYAFSVADLALLAGLVGVLVGGPPSGSRGRWMARLLFLLSSKLAVLGAGVFLMIGNRGIPNASLLSGLGTLIVVPVLGGGLWSFTDPKDET